MSTPIPAIGIDLGTTYSCVGVFQHGKVEIIANDQGNRTTPSYVAFTDTEWFAGDVAKNQSTRNPENTVFDAKRMIGRHYHDKELEGDLKHWPFEVINDGGEPKIRVQYKGETKLYSPVEISSMVLTKLKMTAEAYLGQKVTDAVITVPAYFNNAQRQATKDAGQIAGLNVKRIINEPTAAALAYGLDKKVKGHKKDLNVLIFDLGGGTFDVTVLEFGGDVLEVLSTAGNTHLGGEDFDHRLVQHFAGEFKRQHRKDLDSNPLALRRLKIACEGAKRALSSSSTAPVEVDSLIDGIDFSSKISRARFDELCADLFRGTIDTVKKALDDANLDRSQIDEVVLVGGSTRIPKIRKLLEDFFDGKKLNLRINADEAVAYGAAVQAAALSDVPIPGAGEQLLLDVVPYSLGVREGENNFQKFIERNSRVPISEEKEFSLGSDYQTAASIEVYEGELPLARDNRLLGQFMLEGLPAKKKGEVTLVITYDVDADGIMHVTGKDKLSGKSNEITIRCLEYMGPDELKRMQADAAKMEAEARKQEEARQREGGEEEEEGRRRNSSGDEGQRKPRGMPSGLDDNGRDRRGKDESRDEGKRGDTSQSDRQESTNRRRVGEDKDEGRRKSDDKDQDRESRSTARSNTSGKPSGNDRETSQTRDTGRAADRRSSPTTDRDQSAAQSPRKSDSAKGQEQKKSDSSTTQEGKKSDSTTQEQKKSDSSTTQEDKKSDSTTKDQNQTDSTSDTDLLFMLTTLLEGEVRPTPGERTQIRQHCVRLLTQLAVSKDPKIRAKCKELRKQLRDKYPTEEKKRPPLSERARSYLGELVQTLASLDTADAQEDVEEVSEMCMDLMDELEGEISDEEISKKIEELQARCKDIKGLTMPSDAIIR